MGFTMADVVLRIDDLTNLDLTRTENDSDEQFEQSVSILHAMITCQAADLGWDIFSSVWWSISTLER